ncbi:hypothetical protein BH23PLA1_BH23PLA1_38040 [soil metagenome]
MSVLVQTQKATSPRPSELRPGLNRRLEAICLKAMARDPQNRSPSTADLAEALGKVLCRVTLANHSHPPGLSPAPGPPL